eukprot:TRINITY_DN706_c0_g1_i4.p1 TRINITY_DN706_c0_g1~~TRINITY_DN706_c0_g1_i4.p1  ORF type:complete len:250 (+),score=30.95 TRINITY_DN706_c0_g1_i4:434-1183(+)
MVCALGGMLPKELGGLGNDGTIFYFDIENAFSSNRLVNICTAHPALSSYSQVEDNLISLTRRVLIYRPSSPSQFLEMIDQIGDSKFLEENGRLIVIDSIAALVRKEFDKMDIPKRQMLLSNIASILKEFSENFEIPIIITNQVTSNDMYQTAALGVMWAHSVNNRIVMEYSPSLEREFNNKSIRQMTIAKSPVSPVVSFPYFINDAGINLLKLSDDHNMDCDDDSELDKYVIMLHAENYWNQMIKTTNL